MTDSPLYGEGSAGLGTFVAIRGPTRESRLALWAGRTGRRDAGAHPAQPRIILGAANRRLVQRDTCPFVQYGRFGPNDAYVIRPAFGTFSDSLERYDATSGGRVDTIV